jgi:HK97 family phage portal protein
MKRICALFGVPHQMLGIAEGGKFNNTQTLLDEFYKSGMYPTIVNVQQKMKQSLFQGYPNLSIEFDTIDFLKGAPLDQMNFVTSGVSGGILTPNEAREYIGKPRIEGEDDLIDAGKTEPIPGTSPQDTGGGGGNQTRKMNIGK